MADKAKVQLPPIGSRWRQDDGYVCDVIAHTASGNAWVRHPNAKRPGSGHAVVPAWFAQWERIR